MCFNMWEGSIGVHVATPICRKFVFQEVARCECLSSAQHFVLGSGMDCMNVVTVIAWYLWVYTCNHFCMYFVSESCDHDINFVSPS